MSPPDSSCSIDLCPGGIPEPDTAVPYRVALRDGAGSLLRFIAIEEARLMFESGLAEPVGATRLKYMRLAHARHSSVPSDVLTRRKLGSGHTPGPYGADFWANRDASAGTAMFGMPDLRLMRIEEPARYAAYWRGTKDSKPGQIRSSNRIGDRTIHFSHS
jgi:hypothetical protein